MKLLESFRQKDRVEYEPEIDSRHIRLIQICQSERRLFPGRIRVQMSTHSLEEAKAIGYHALSYTWGPPEENGKDASSASSILVNGERLDIKPNLHDALSFFYWYGRYLWIDAICINQESEREKEAQVRIMGEIYSMAEKVIVWLGNGRQDSPATIPLIQKLSDLFDESDAEETRRILSEDSPFERLGLPPSSSSDWISLFTLLKRNWFRRAWVMQEVALAKDTCFYYGWNGMATWEEFRDAIRMLERLGWALRNSPVRDPKQLKDPKQEKISPAIYFVNRMNIMKSIVEDLEPSQCSSIISEIEETTGTNAWKKNSSPLLARLLMKCNKVRATKSQDKVYAFLGLVNVAATKLGIPGWTIEVDYNSDPAEFFTTVTGRILNDCNHLGFITTAGLAEYDNGIKVAPLPGLPSWVPDFSDSACHARTSPVISTYRAVPSDASRYGELGSLGFRIMGHRLEVKARRVGCILSGSYPASELGADTIEPFASLLLQCGQTYRPTGVLSIEAFWRTLIFDTDLYLSTAGSELRGCFKAWITRFIYLALQVWKRDSYKNILAFQQMTTYRSLAIRDGSAAREMLPSIGWMNTKLRNLNPTHLLKFPPSLRFVEEFLDKHMGSESVKDLADTCYRADQYEMLFDVRSRQRRVFLTDEGHLGMAVLSATEGDSVWVVSSCPVPLVLRPRVDGSFQLVGDCYVYGIMNGEAVKENRWEDITIT